MLSRPEVKKGVDYATSFGTDLIAQPWRPTIILNRTYPDGNALRPRIMPNPIKGTDFSSTYGVPNDGKFEILNIDTADAGKTFWDNYNQPYLAFGEGFHGVFLIATDPSDPKNLWNEDGTVTAFADELNYLRGVEEFPRPDPAPTYVYSPMDKAFYPAPEQG